MRGPSRVALVVSIAIGIHSRLASATDDGTRAAARVLGNTGVEAYQRGDFATANDKLDRAYHVLQAPSLGLWSARALVKVGKYVEAAQRYLDVTRLTASDGAAEVQRQAKVDVQKDLDALTPRIPSVVIRVNGAETTAVRVTLDGVEVPSALLGETRPVNPGVHQAEGTRGADHSKVSVTVADGEQKSALLAFKSTAPLEAQAHNEAESRVDPRSGANDEPARVSSTDVAGASHSSSVVPWIVLGAGSAGLVFGGVTGALVLSKNGTIDASGHCADNRCLPSETSRVNSYNSLRTVSTVSLIAGGVAATGVVLLVTSHRSSERAARLQVPRASGPTLSLAAGLGNVTFTGSF
jgi:hypothetical protein